MALVVDAFKEYDSKPCVTMLKSTTKHSSSFPLSCKDTSTNKCFLFLLRILVALVVLQCRRDLLSLGTMPAQLHVFMVNIIHSRCGRFMSRLSSAIPLYL